MTLTYIIISVFFAFSLATMLVEKKGTWPVNKVAGPLDHFLGIWHSRLPEMLDCIPCTAFWAALLGDLFFLFVSGFSYFLWPVSGIVSWGVSWFLISWLNAMEGPVEDDEQTN